MAPIIDQKIVVEMWSDLICPWCRIGEKNFAQALEAFAHRDAVDIVLRSYRLMPGSETMPVERVMQEKYGLEPDEITQSFAKLEATAAGVGLHYHLAGSWAGDTVDGHRLVKLAQTVGKGQAMFERLFSAAMCEQLCIQEHAVLRALALEEGLAAGDIDRVLEGNEYRLEVEADEQTMKGYGGRGVPFFVINGRYDYSGALAPDIFLSGLMKAWQDAGTVKVADVTDVADVVDSTAMVCGPEGCILPER